MIHPLGNASLSIPKRPPLRAGVTLLGESDRNPVTPLASLLHAFFPLLATA